MPFHFAEESVQQAVRWLRLGIETTGALVVAIGFVVALGLFVQTLARRSPDGFTSIRLVLARYLAVALEFQLGADILSTAIAPSWTQIGQLATIAVIRTFLNYFLAREMREEEHTLAHEQNVVDRADGKQGEVQGTSGAV